MDIIIQILILILLGGVPYFYFLSKLEDKNIFYIASILLIIGTVSANLLIDIKFSNFIIIVSIISSIIAAFKAYKTTNLYKLSYLFIFINAPISFIIEPQYSLWYIISLLLTTTSVFMLAKYFEKTYASANFYSIRALTIKTPKLAFFLKIYLLSIALFPPFPNSIFLLEMLLQSDAQLIVLITFIVVFIANFLIAVDIITRTSFGKGNEKIHYIDLKGNEYNIHLMFIAIIICLSIYAITRILG